jgi:arginase
MLKKIHTLGSASGIAAREHTSEDGPFVIQHSPFNNLLTENKLELQWEDLIYFPCIGQALPQPDIMKNVEALCTQLAKKIETIASPFEKEGQARFSSRGKPFLTIGGDHSCAVGTWSGAAAALKHHGNIGLIWIDAHMDSHTPTTTESGYIHGMPLAALMGHGDPRLTHIIFAESKLQPQSVVLIGVRSFERGEAELLKQLNVRIFDMPEIHARGLNAVMQEAIEIVSKDTIGYGVSIDIDSIDPSEAPGTGAEEPNGISSQALCSALRHIAADKRFIGAEIAEFDPHKDKNQKTEKIVFELITALFNSDSHN